MPTEAVPSDRLLLAQQARGLVGVAPPLGDVLDDPHRALLRVAGIDRLGDHAADEGRAVLALHLPLEVELAPGRQHRPGDLAEREVALAARVDDFARHADQLVGAVAEHLGELRIAQEKAPLAREGDAEREVGEQRLVLELGVARAPGVGTPASARAAACRSCAAASGRSSRRPAPRSLRRSGAGCRARGARCSGAERAVDVQEQREVLLAPRLAAPRRRPGSRPRSQLASSSGSRSRASRARMMASTSPCRRLRSRSRSSSSSGARSAYSRTRSTCACDSFPTQSSSRSMTNLARLRRRARARCRAGSRAGTCRFSSAKRRSICATCSGVSRSSSGAAISAALRRLSRACTLRESYPQTRSSRDSPSAKRARRFARQARILRQRILAVPGVKFVDAVVELVGLFALQVDVAVPAFQRR